MTVRQPSTWIVCRVSENEPAATPKLDDISARWVCELQLTEMSSSIELTISCTDDVNKEGGLFLMGARQAFCSRLCWSRLRGQKLRYRL